MGVSVTFRDILFSEESTGVLTLEKEEIVIHNVNRGEMKQMPWTLNDYPDSLKNLNKATRKKAIEIANSMLDDGYDEGRAIPIATSKAKEWFNDANENEIASFLKRGETQPDSNRESSSRPELNEKPQFVTPHSDGGWAVQSEDAKQPSDVFDTKPEAVKRGKEIAQNKGTQLIIHKQDGSVDEKIQYGS